MIISNGEPFITLRVAVNAFYYDELFMTEHDEKYFDQLSSWLDIYAFINGVCNIHTPANPTIDDKIDRFPKKINGMCEIEINFPSYELITYHGGKPSIDLKASPFIEGISNDLIGCLIIPIDKHINYDSLFGLSYVHLTQFINHAKEVGVDINAIFLEEIISGDNTFKELKRLSKIAPGGQFNIKQAASKYLKYFNCILEETIITACELASARYDRINQKTNAPQEISEENIDNIANLLSNTPITTKNIELFKSTLPDVWREALFNDINKAIENSTTSNIDSKELATREKNSFYKIVGLLSLAIAKKNPNKFGDISKINALQIYEELVEFLPLEPVGLGDKTIRTKIKQGVELLRDA